jgi:serine/threonine-protein kinase HipA
MKFKLAMSVGKNRHYPVESIMPRHLLQTAERAGVGAPLMRGLFEAIAANAQKKTDEILAALPKRFPEELAVSVKSAVHDRTRLIAEALGG